MHEGSLSTGKEKNIGIRMLACDLHVHSSHSRDGESMVADIILHAEKRGLDGIAITDHDTMDAIQEALGIQTSLIIIPGMEISTKQGHLLALGIQNPIPAGLDIMDTIVLIREQKGVSILPHPYHRYRHGAGLVIPQVISAVDAIEVFNSRYIIGTANQKAKLVAIKEGKPMIGGSDAHQADFVGYGVTYIDANPDVSSIIEAIRNGKTEYTGKKTPVTVYTGQSAKNTWNKVKRRINR